MKFLFSIILFPLIFISSLSAAKVPVDGMVSLCKIYPQIGNLAPMPTKFNTSNNLVLADISGFYKAEGRQITIYGRIMDESCVPIDNATIYIWQANKEGYIQYPGAPKAKWRDPNFDGTGIIKSDNLGRFNFTTIMPGRRPKSLTPFINFKVEHKDLKTFKSKIYFPDSIEFKIRENFSINRQNQKIISAVNAENNENIYNIDIVLKNDLAFKEY